MQRNAYEKLIERVDYLEELIERVDYLKAKWEEIKPNIDTTIDSNKKLVDKFDHEITEINSDLFAFKGNIKMKENAQKQKEAHHISYF